MRGKAYYSGAQDREIEQPVTTLLSGPCAVRAFCQLVLAAVLGPRASAALLLLSLLDLRMLYIARATSNLAKPGTRPAPVPSATDHLSDPSLWPTWVYCLLQAALLGIQIICTTGTLSAILHATVRLPMSRLDSLSMSSLLNSSLFAARGKARLLWARIVALPAEVRAFAIVAILGLLMVTAMLHTLRRCSGASPSARSGRFVRAPASFGPDGSIRVRWRWVPAPEKHRVHCEPITVRRFTLE
ncbi:hypothetical protein BD414DRAFT_501768 [Trametes punicea]|nr:hypothetical protein BD414DRAFT_501768 [Trametes punicea]